MRLMAGFKRLLRLPHPDVRRDVDDELKSHIEMKAAELVEAGLDPDAARAEAHNRFGNLRSIRRRCNGIQSEHVRNTARGEFVDALWQDLRIGTRLLRRNPGFATITVLTLALGIGANTAMFTVVDAVLLRPLPFKDPHRLVAIWETKLPQWPDFAVAPVNFVDWQQRSTVFDFLAVGAGAGTLILTGGDEPQELQTAQVSSDLFTMLEVAPLYGRVFRREEFEPSHDVVLVSHRLWQQHFGGDLDLIGRQIMLSDRSYTVIGIMPPDFEVPNRTTDIWRPLVLEPNLRERRPLVGRIFPNVTGRLKPGVTVEQARRELEVIAAQLAEEYPGFNDGWSIRLESLIDHTIGDVRPALLLLLGAVGLLLLIASTNVAGLVLSRGIERHRETAIRSVLGAGRGRIVRQLLTEGLILGFTGAFAGLLLAYWVVRAILAFAPEELPRVHHATLDASALSFALGVTLLAVMICSLVPALRVSKVGPGEALKGPSNRIGSARSIRVFGRVGPRSALVIAQMALSLLLLVGAGLLIRSFVRLQQVHPGLEPQGVLMAEIRLPRSRYQSPADVAEFYERLTGEVSALPGVAFAAIGDEAIGCCGAYNDWEIQGVAPGQPAETGAFRFHRVGVDYFRTLGIPLLRGRTFSPNDRVREFTGSFWRDSSVAWSLIINETMAKRDFPGDNPVGKRIIAGRSLEIIGVVGDVRLNGQLAEAPAQMYSPYLQGPASGMWLLARTESDPLRLVPAVRARVATIDPDQPITQFLTMEEHLSDSLARQRFTMLLMAVFGGLALVLVISGIYGVASYAVAQRTHEFGIRRALGAGTASVLQLVLRDGLRLSLVGLAIGLVAAVWLTRLIASQLFGVTPTDPVTFVAVGTGLVAVAVLASYVPARRATRVDPMMALRAE
jgi:predicted permease